MEGTQTQHAKTVVSSIDNFKLGQTGLNLDLVNLTTDFGLKKKTDNPTWEKVQPKNYLTKKYIPPVKRKRPKKKKELKPFHSFKADSHNAKASMGKQKEQEIDNIEMRYKAMIDGLTKEFKDTDAQNENAPQQVQVKKRPKTALPREIQHKQALLKKQGFGTVECFKQDKDGELGINQLGEQKKKEQVEILTSSAPKRRLEVIIPKSKRVKRKQRPVQDEGPEIGTKIPQTKLQLADQGPTPFTDPKHPFMEKLMMQVDKSQFKHWQPWLVESTLPKWAQDLQESNLKTILIQDSLKGEQGLQEQVKWWERQTKNNVELPLTFYRKFKLNDKVMSYSNLRPRVEPRLAEIYRKFAQKLTQYEHELEDNFNLQPFDPVKAREDLAERRERAERKAKLQQDVEREIEEIYHKKSQLPKRPVKLDTRYNLDLESLHSEEDFGTLEAPIELQNLQSQEGQEQDSDTPDGSVMEEQSDTPDGSIKQETDTPDASFRDEDSDTPEGSMKNQHSNGEQEGVDSFEETKQKGQKMEQISPSRIKQALEDVFARTDMVKSISAIADQSGAKNTEVTKISLMKAEESESVGDASFMSEESFDSGND